MQTFMNSFQRMIRSLRHTKWDWIISHSRGIKRITLCSDSHRYIDPGALTLTILRDRGNEHKKITKAMNKYSQLKWMTKEMDTITWLHQDLESHLVLCLANIWNYKIISNQHEWNKGLQWTTVELFPFAVLG